MESSIIVLLASGVTIAATSICLRFPESAVTAVHTFGNFKQFNPHLHIIATDGCFFRQQRFYGEPLPCGFGLARPTVVTHIPYRGEQMVRYYGFYSNKSRGLRKKAGSDYQVLSLIDSDISRKAFRKNWARLIQKVYNVDP